MEELRNKVLLRRPDLREKIYLLDNWNFQSSSAGLHFQCGPKETGRVQDLRPGLGCESVTTRNQAGRQEESGEGTALISKTNNHNGPYGDKEFFKPESRRGQLPVKPRNGRRTQSATLPRQCTEK